MAFVLDASVALAWLLPDEKHPALEVLQDSLVDDRAIVPVRVSKSSQYCAI